MRHTSVSACRRLRVHRSAEVRAHRIGAPLALRHQVPRFGLAVTAVIIAVAASLPSSAVADEAPRDVDERLAFLEERIETQHLHAQVWWESWITFYGVGLIVQSARAIEATDTAERADLIISAVKAAGGVVRYAVDPMKGIQSFESVPGESQAARLARGERILRENADATTPFGPWYAHLINFGINGTGAVIVGAGFDDWKQGLISGGIGFAVGEISLFTQPWEAGDDLEEYEARFGKGQNARRPPQTQLRLVQMGAGAGLHLSF